MQSMGPVFREDKAVGFKTGRHMSLFRLLWAYMHNRVLEFNSKFGSCFAILTFWLMSGNNLFATLLNHPTFLSQLLLIVRVSAVIWQAGRRCPFLQSARLFAPSSLPLPGSWRWRGSRLGHLFSLKNLGGWRGLWWNSIRGIFPVPVQKERAE